MSTLSEPIMDNKPKILLLNPPADLFTHKPFRASFPIGLCYLGTHLKNLGYRVKIVDTQIEAADKTKLSKKNMVRVGLRQEGIEDFIRDFAPDVLGISCNFHTNFNPSLDIAKAAKTKCGVKHVILGGNYASVVPNRIMGSSFVDYLVIGEGEEVFAQVLERLFDGYAAADRFGAIDGVAYRDNSANVHYNRKTRFISPQDFITPDRDLLPVEKYIRLRRPYSVLPKGRRVLEVVTSRGCNAACTFCSASRLWGRFRGRPAEDVISELKLLKERYDIDEVQFIDDNFTADRNRAEAIFQMMLDEKLNLKWCTPNGIALYTIDEKLIKLMKQSGCYMVVLPIESGSQRVLSKLMQKPLLLDKVHSLVRDLRRYKIGLQAYLLVGMPGETFSDIKETFNFVFQLGIFKAHFNYVLPVPSTPVYEEYLKGLRASFGEAEYDYDADQEYYLDFKSPLISTKEWTPQELKKFVSSLVLKLYLKFLFFKPHIFLREINEIICTNPRLLLEIINFYRSFIFKSNSLDRKS
jgi:anaerobic magnesium-protoporphyrin IX monomethyl ester cyclase